MRDVYRFWAPVYDAVFGPAFRRARGRAIELLELRPGERVLLSGVGTGLDLPLLPGGVDAVGVDLSEDMLKRAREKTSPAKVELRAMNAQELEFEEASFDAAILNLIVSVVPDGARAFAEAYRVVRPGGRIVVFDKFLPEGREASIADRALGAVVRRLGTDPNRKLSDVLGAAKSQVTHEEPSVMRGRYRIVIVRRR